MYSLCNLFIYAYLRLISNHFLALCGQQCWTPENQREGPLVRAKRFTLFNQIEMERNSGKIYVICYFDQDNTSWTLKTVAFWYQLLVLNIDHLGSHVRLNINLEQHIISYTHKWIQSESSQNYCRYLDFPTRKWHISKTGNLSSASTNILSSNFLVCILQHLWSIGQNWNLETEPTLGTAAIL